MTATSGFPLIYKIINCTVKLVALVNTLFTGYNFRKRSNALGALEVFLVFANFADSTASCVGTSGSND